MAKVFISYRRDDSKYQARMIYAAFCQVVASENVFMDVDSIPPGANFRKILKGWVDECDVLLALIGPGWIDATDPKTGRPRILRAANRAWGSTVRTKNNQGFRLARTLNP